jgi:hypothetical protein
LRSRTISFAPFDIAECPQCGRPGGVGVEATCNVVGRLLGDMRRDFLIETAAATPEHHASSFVRMLEHATDRANHSFPPARFRGELLPARPGELVETRAAIEPGNPPLRLDQMLTLQPL